MNERRFLTMVESSDETYRLAACDGKQAHDRSTARMIARKSKHPNSAAYECQHCGHWHVGVKASRKIRMKKKV